MNYTENYHLPQWDEDDRIMRVDFNQMCADMDAGLAENAGRTRKGLDWLWRLAYNHLCALQDAGPVPQQIGVFYQNPAEDDSGFTGIRTKNGFCFTGTGTTYVSTANFTQYAEQLTGLKVVKGDLENAVPLTVGICAPSAGYISQFVLRGQFANNIPNTPAPFRLTMTNQRTGEVEQTVDLDFAEDGYSGVIVNHFLKGPFYFHGGDQYIMKLEPLEAAYDLNVDAVFTEYTSVEDLYNNSPMQASRVMNEVEESSGGLLVLRCAMGGPDGKLTVEWDGKEMKPAAVRLLPHSDGRVIREHLYFRDETIPATTSISLRFDCGKRGDIWIYDWGAILL